MSDKDKAPDKPIDKKPQRTRQPPTAPPELTAFDAAARDAVLQQQRKAEKAGTTTSRPGNEGG